MAYLKQVVTNQLATTHEMTFFSEVDDLITVNAAAADETFPPVTVADVPAGATVVRAILGVIVGEFEDTSTAENSVVLAGTEHFQIDKTGGTYIDAIKLLAGQWLTPASGRRGGTVLIGDIDISSEVDDNDTYEIKWEGADVTGASLLLRDVQTFIKLWYTIE
jgi:predicted secreted protein